MIKHIHLWYFPVGLLFILIGIVVLIPSDSNKALGIIFLIIGIAFLIGGIVHAIFTRNQNQALRKEKENIVYITACPHCNREVSCYIDDFEPHSRYPEGYIYCPICKKPISKNAFEEYYEN